MPSSKKEALDIMFETFLPIVLKDKDIIRFIQKNELDEEQAKKVATHLTAFAAGYYLFTVDQKKFARDIERANDIVNKIEAQLSEEFDDIHDVLQEVLKQNIEEWFDIIREMLQKAHVEEEGDSEINEDSDPEKIVKGLHQILLPIVIREDDVTEFAEQFNEKAKSFIINFICSVTLLNWAAHFQQNPDELSEDNPIRINIDGIYKLLSDVVNNAAQFVDSKIDDYEEFKNQVNEIISDHFNEFVKKMYKAISREVNK